MWRGRSTTKAFPPSKRRPKVTSKSLKPIRSGSRAYAAGSGLGKHSNRCLHAPVIHDVRHYYSESVLVFLTLLIGTIFYSFQEGWGLIDAFYFSVTTLTTVGLGDPAPATPVGKLFTVGYILSGLGLIAGFINAIAAENLSSRTRRPRNAGDQEEDTGDV